MSEWKFGIEAEYALIRPDGRFADFTNTEYHEVKPLLDPLPDYNHPELRVGDAGIRVKNWYVEGDERFDERGRSTGLAFKGIEIRTPVYPTIEESISSLQELRTKLAVELQASGWSFLSIAFNPCTSSYNPNYAQWERDFHDSHIENALPDISTLSFGPDLNFSRAGQSPDDVLKSVRRLTYYSPYVVPFSFGSPFVDRKLWRGLSYRTYTRTGPRPAALAHLSGEPFHRLVKRADPPSQHLRVEFKAFDMVGNDALLAELFYLVVGVTLADERSLPGLADLPDIQLHRNVALSGFDADDIHDLAAKILDVAVRSLRSEGFSTCLPLLSEMLNLRQTPAHAMRERFSEWAVLLGFD